mgnify:CR=1 FL=1|tara:strand:- start:34052 stop:34387 length:336 start_codon:yes stop_codon:yes gene_type:complete
MRESNKKRHILKLYTNDTTITHEELALLTESSLYYIKQVIRDFHTDSVAYYDYCISPSCVDEGIYFLFSSNGEEKKLKKTGNYIYPETELTQLEELYIRINLGKNIFYKNN